MISASLPSVDTLLNLKEGKVLISDYGRELTLQSIRAELDLVRNKVAEGEPVPDSKTILMQSRKEWTSG
jgi:hypothetical protein